jgi:hypothetical protein
MTPQKGDAWVRRRSHTEPPCGSSGVLGAKGDDYVTAAQFEQLTPTEVEGLLRHRLREFLDAGAAPGGALLLAAQVEIDVDAAIDLLSRGCSAELTLRILL